MFIRINLRGFQVKNAALELWYIRHYKIILLQQFLGILLSILSQFLIPEFVENNLLFKQVGVSKGSLVQLPFKERLFIESQLCELRIFFYHFIGQFQLLIQVLQHSQKRRLIDESIQLLFVQGHEIHSPVHKLCCVLELNQSLNIEIRLALMVPERFLMNTQLSVDLRNVLKMALDVQSLFQN